MRLESEGNQADETGESTTGKGSNLSGTSGRDGRGAGGGRGVATAVGGDVVGGSLRGLDGGRVGGRVSGNAGHAEGRVGRNTAGAAFIVSKMHIDIVRYLGL